MPTTETSQPQNVDQTQKKIWFADKEILSRVAVMTDSEMEALLRDLAKTSHWIAILRYFQARAALALNSLQIIDPVTEAARIARVQGILAGVNDLPDAIGQLVASAEAKEGEKVVEVPKTN